MRRIGLAIVLMVSLLASRAAEAQPAAKVYRIAVLINSDSLKAVPNFDGFREGLHDLGYVEGRNIVVDVRGSESYERLAHLAAELVRFKPDVIVASSSTAIDAVTTTTRAIPLVMMNVEATYYVARLSRPGENLTGLSNMTQHLSGKRLELLREAVPDLTRVAVLSNARNTSHPRQLDWTRTAAAQLGMRLTVVEVRGPEHLSAALAGIKREQIDGLVVLLDSVFINHRQEIIKFATVNRLPCIFPHAQGPIDGALMSYAADLREQWRRAAVYVDRILKGAKPGDLPVEQPTKFELAINLKTAKALGLTIPQSVLIRADEIIQ